MKIVSWRNTAIVLAALCCYQHWHGDAPAAAPTEPARPAARPAAATARPASPVLPGAPSLAVPGGESGSGKSFYGFKLPAWALRLAPQPGETARAYRDRILPLAELAVAPQRARVARTRDDFAGLDPRQRAELDAAVAESGRAIQDRIAAALASGELRPATLKPMTGVALARDVLDIVDRGNTRFQQALTSDQRTRLASHRFDFADYLLFTTRWEDALRALDR
ncbi:MAG TPA: hypothetical protein VK607_21205 [Kofleriaceae bacterium]|nr:hypothetical protein [Kofleriaceae bacterium]